MVRLNIINTCMSFLRNSKRWLRSGNDTQEWVLFVFYFFQSSLVYFNPSSRPHKPCKCCWKCAIIDVAPIGDMATFLFSSNYSQGDTQSVAFMFVSFFLLLSLSRLKRTFCHQALSFAVFHECNPAANGHVYMNATHPGGQKNWHKGSSGHFMWTVSAILKRLRLILLLQVKSTKNDMFCVLYTSFSLVLYIFQSYLLLPSCLSKVIPLSICMCFVCACANPPSTEKHPLFDGTPRSSLIFPIDFLLFSFLHSQEMGCLNWSRPVEESVSDRQTERWWGKSKKKTQGRNIEKRRRKRQEGPTSSLITEALADPWPWSWPQRLPHRSEVVWKCQCGNSLHCWVVMILCSLPSLSDMISVALCLRLPRATHPSLTRPHKAH